MQVYGLSLLAESAHCRIERCKCGTLHLTIGALTLRTTRDVLRAVVDTAGAALGTLEIDDVRRLGLWRAEGGTT